MNTEQTNDNIITNALVVGDLNIDSLNKKYLKHYLYDLCDTFLLSNLISGSLVDVMQANRPTSFHPTSFIEAGMRVIVIN